MDTMVKVGPWAARMIELSVVAVLCFGAGCLYQDRMVNQAEVKAQVVRMEDRVILLELQAAASVEETKNIQWRINEHEATYHKSFASSQ